MRHPGQGAGQVPGHVRVPGVRVHQVHTGQRIGHRQIHRQGLQRGIRRGKRGGDGMSMHARPGGTETVHRHLAPVPQFGHQVTDVHPGSAIYLGGVLPGQHADPDAGTDAAHVT